MNDYCSVNYEDDRDYDYIIERLNHIEEEIKFIKKTLEHKRVKEAAWEQLRQEAEYERVKDAGGATSTFGCKCSDDDKEEEASINPEVKELIDEILKKLDEHKNTTITYTLPPNNWDGNKIPYWKRIGDFPYTTWF